MSEPIVSVPSCSSVNARDVDRVRLSGVSAAPAVRRRVARVGVAVVAVIVVVAAAGANAPSASVAANNNISLRSGVMVFLQLLSNCGIILFRGWHVKPDRGALFRQVSGPLGSWRETTNRHHRRRQYGHHAQQGRALPHQARPDRRRPRRRRRAGSRAARAFAARGHAPGHRRRQRTDRVARSQHHLRLHAYATTIARSPSRCCAAGKALFCEKPLAFNADGRRRDERRREARRRHAPGRARDALLGRHERHARARPRCPAPAAPMTAVADRRPVLPHPGPLRQHVARRRLAGRRRHAAGARHPRHRHPGVVLRPRAARARRRRATSPVTKASRTSATPCSSSRAAPSSATSRSGTTSCIAAPAAA